MCLVTGVFVMISKTAIPGNFVLCNDGVYIHKSVKPIRDKAVKMLDHANESDIHHILETRFSEIADMDNRGNPTGTICTDNPTAIITMATLMFYHGGAEIVADSKGKSWGISSKGYYHYCG